MEWFKKLNEQLLKQKVIQVPELRAGGVVSYNTIKQWADENEYGLSHDGVWLSADKPETGTSNDGSNNTAPINVQYTAGSGAATTN